MSRYLSLGAAGEVRTASPQCFELPGRADYLMKRYIVSSARPPLLEGRE